MIPRSAPRMPNWRWTSPTLGALDARYADYVKRRERLPPSVSMLKIWATETYQRIGLAVTCYAGDSAPLAGAVDLGGSCVHLLAPLLKPVPPESMAEPMKCSATSWHVAYLSCLADCDAKRVLTVNGFGRANLRCCLPICRERCPQQVPPAASPHRWGTLRCKQNATVLQHKHNLSDQPPYSEFPNSGKFGEMWWQFQPINGLNCRRHVIA